MLAHDEDSRVRAQHHYGLSAEGLESRQMLDAASSNVASALTYSIGLPIASLATGANLPLPAGIGENSSQTTQEIVNLEIMNAPDQPVPGIGLATPAQTVQGFTASVSLPVVESSNGQYGSAFATNTTMFGPTGSGPSTTLNPLGNRTETAVAASSVVVQPTPGRSDRISTIIRALPIIPLPHYPAPGPEIIAEPEIRQVPVVPAPKPAAQPVMEKAAPVEPPAPAQQPIEGVETPVPKAEPVAPRSPMSFQAIDRAIDLVEGEMTELKSPWLDPHAEGSMAVGALLAILGGWKTRTIGEGRSRRRAESVEGIETGPELGAGR
jgi:hypothetical protein